MNPHGEHVHPPSEATLAEVEARLRKRPRWATLAVGGGVQMRLSGGERRFLIRPRIDGKQETRTFDSWQQAYDAGRELRHLTFLLERLLSWLLLHALLRVPVLGRHVTPFGR